MPLTRENVERCCTIHGRSPFFPMVNSQDSFDYYSAPLVMDANGNPGNPNDSLYWPTLHDEIPQLETPVNTQDGLSDITDDEEFELDIRDLMAQALTLMDRIHALHEKFLRRKTKADI